MKQHTMFIVLSFAILMVLACDATQLFTAFSAPTATAPQPGAVTSPRRAESPAPPRRSTPVFPLASPTPTSLPMHPISTVTPAVSNHAFHINFIMDETATCPGSAKCDNAYIPKMVLYLRGNVNVAANRASGDGTMMFISVDACKTLLPDTSSCKVNGTTNGSFTISGQMQADKLEMTLHLREMPRISVVMTSKHPSGPVTVAYDSTYQEEMKKVFENAKIFETPIQATPTIASGNPAAYFEGTYTFGGARTLHGYGGLFFIPTDSPLPKVYAP